MLPDTAAIKGELNLRDLATAGKPPNKFLSLDIETSGGTLSNLETMELVVAGVVEFAYQSDFSVEYQTYETWGKSETEGLGKRLTAFDGLIIGMNLFGFDYKILRKYIDVEALRHKTLDFQLFLRSVGGENISLNNLSKSSLGKSQIPVKYYSSTLADQRHKTLTKRNRVDCELTAQLYVFYVSNGFLFNKQRVTRPEFVIDKLNTDAINTVTGCKEQINAADYQYFRQIPNRFLGIPWLEIKGYDPTKSSYYPLMACSCGYRTVICLPNNVSVKKILKMYTCPQCKAPSRHRTEETHIQNDLRYQMLSELFVYSHKALTTTKFVPYPFYSTLATLLNQLCNLETQGAFEELRLTIRDFQQKYDEQIFRPKQLSQRIRRRNLDNDELFLHWVKYLPQDFITTYRQFRKSSASTIPVPSYFKLENELGFFEEADGNLLFARNSNGELNHNGRSEHQFITSLKSTFKNGVNRARIWRLRRLYYSTDYWRNLEELSIELNSSIT